MESSAPPDRLDALTREVHELRKILGLLVWHLSGMEWDLSVLQSNLQHVRADIEKTTPNALTHAWLKEDGPVRVLELLHTRWYEEAEELDLPDIMAWFHDPSDPPRKKRRRRSRTTPDVY